MIYLSPFHFLQHQPGQTDWYPTDLVRARKRLLAELVLNPAAYGGNRNDLLARLDGLDTSTLQHHYWIFGQKPLLAFLETGETAGLDWPALNRQLLADPNRRAFVLEYFAEAYATHLADVLRNGTPEQATQLAAVNPEGLTFRQQRRWLSPAADVLARLYALIGELKEQMTPETMTEWLHNPQLMSWGEPILRHRLAAVPAYFSPYRDEIILALNDMALHLIELDKKHKAPEQLEFLIIGLFQVIHKCPVSRRCLMVLRAKNPEGKFARFKPEQ